MVAQCPRQDERHDPGDRHAAGAGDDQRLRRVGGVQEETTVNAAVTDQANPVSRFPALLTRKPPISSTSP
jgi:hypothetical protein